MVTGGGSGGHITPVLAVAKQLKAKQSDSQIVYIGQRGDGLADIPRQHASIDRAYDISAGKLRRYHGEGLRQLLDIKTMALNLRDMFRVLAGIWQAYWLLGKEKPSVIFVKGGFVGVPVGLAAAARGIPFVTHDSDAIPGLANRIIARWARFHAVALPKEAYSYPPQRTMTVGVPVAEEFASVDSAAQATAKAKLGYAKDDIVLLVTGGGLGAQRINDAILHISPDLFTAVPRLKLVLTVGRANEAAITERFSTIAEARDNVKVLGYTTDMALYSAAADLIVMRAGATAIAEFAVQGKACVLVPNPLLTGGHQLKNATVLQEAEAVAVIDEKMLRADLPLVLSTIAALLQDEDARRRLGKNLQQFSHPESASELADLLLKTAAEKRSNRT